MRARTSIISAVLIGMIGMAALALGGCGCHGALGLKQAPSLALRTVVLHGTLTSNGAATVLVDGAPATISGATWSKAVTLTTSPQSVVVTLLTNGLPIAERVITVQ